MCSYENKSQKKKRKLRFKKNPNNDKKNINAESMILRKQQQCTTYTGECVKKEHTRSPTLQHNKCRPHILLGPERPSGGRAPPQLPGLNNTKITEAEKEKENLSVMGVEIICRVKVCTSTLLLAFFSSFVVIIITEGRNRHLGQREMEAEGENEELSRRWEEEEEEKYFEKKY